MSESTVYRKIMAGAGGAWAAPLRGLLRVAAAGYGLAVDLRNQRYDRRGPRLVLPVPVISVGNITVGGTGKTPLVIDIVRRLERMGCTPAVVSRGYKAVDSQPNDEEQLIRRSCPNVPCVADADRGHASEIALRRFDADVIVLDDGFQHRQLGRTVDIVVIDATCPFGYGHLLPRGLLREPARALRRANLVVLTRCDQVAPTRLDRIARQVANLAVNAATVQCRHEVTGVERLDGEPLAESIAGRKAVVFAGIGRPQAFATTVESLDVEVVARRWWPDHHHYRKRDLVSLLTDAKLPRHDLLLTTEKDAAKIGRLKGVDTSRFHVVTVAIDFAGNSGTILQNILEQAVQQHPAS